MVSQRSPKPLSWVRFLPPLPNILLIFSDAFYMKHKIHIFGRPIGLVIAALYKAAWGMTECTSGLLLMFSGRIISGELVEDPQDLFINWLLHSANFNPLTAAHVGSLLLALGIIKLAIAAGIWFGSWKTRRVLILFLSIITAYAVFDLAEHFNILKTIAFFSDLIILLYLWKFLPKHLRRDK